MNAEELYTAAVGVALEQIGSEIYEFVPGWEAARVQGKWFMLTTFRGERMVILKAEVEEGRALRETYPFITEGYHMNKKHWITVRPSPQLDEQLLRELIRDSYLNVLKAR